MPVSLQNAQLVRRNEAGVRRANWPTIWLPAPADCQFVLLPITDTTACPVQISFVAADKGEVTQLATHNMRHVQTLHHPTTLCEAKPECVGHNIRLAAQCQSVTY